MEEKHDFETLDALIRRHVADALTVARGNQREAASLLGITRWKLARMLKRFDLRGRVSAMRDAHQSDWRMPTTEDASPLSGHSHDH